VNIKAVIPRKKKLLISAPVDFMPILKTEMLSEFDCTFSYGAGREETATKLKNHSFDAWLVSPCPTYKIEGKMIDLCPSLKIVATPSTGSNHLDVTYIEKKGIGFYCLRDTEIVNEIYASSEFTFNLMISTIRKTPFAFESVRKGQWRNVESSYRGRELNGLTLGVIGYGRIGGNMARYSRAFGMNIVSYDPYVIIENANVQQADSIDELLAVADVIVLCVHLNDETYRMVDTGLFEKMKHGVYFINTSRGDVVDEAALIKYLRNGKIEAAGLDVISEELTGNKDEHPLIRYARKHDNLIITPHMAGLTYDSELKAQTAAFHAIKDFLKTASKH
jgi:D-3-phosphoglycerate dehydrogenase / 2-oxoglutarate reductase